MKIIVAYVVPDHLQQVIDALSAHQVADLLVSPARRVVQEHARSGSARADYLGIAMARKVRLEFACEDDAVDPILDVLRQRGRSGTQPADLVMVLSVDRVLGWWDHEPPAGGARPEDPQGGAS